MHVYVQLLMCFPFGLTPLLQETPLHCACRNANIEAILLLIEHASDLASLLDATDQYQRTPLQTLSMKGMRYSCDWDNDQPFSYLSIQRVECATCPEEGTGYQLR